MSSLERARINMVENQLRPNRITDARVLKAMASIPRENFVPPLLREVAYVDEDLPLGEDRFLMEPLALARLLQAAEIRPEDVILDIGSGSGYTAAVCSRLAATVVALESDSKLIAEAERLLNGLDAENVVTVNAPLEDGYPTQAPFEVIVFSGAVGRIPETIESQLAEGGRLVAVVNDDHGGQVVLARKLHGIVSRRVVGEASVPSLPGFDKRPAFVF